MAGAPKKIAEVGPFVVYKLGRVLIVYEGADFYCNWRPADAAFANPVRALERVLANRAEAEADKAAARGNFRAMLAAARAERAAQIARQGAFAW